MSTNVQHYFDPVTSTLTYIVYDSDTHDAVVIDPVLDFDPADGRTQLKSVRQVDDFIVKNKLKLHFILETHAHADHISGAKSLKALYPKARIAISRRITEVQKIFAPVFNFKNLKTDGSQFDLLLDDGKEIAAGVLRIKTIFTPGHTPACACYLIGDMLFTGDSIFMPDSGTGRCDFPAGSAEDLYESITGKIFSLPDSTKIFVGHDYQPNGRELKFQTTVAEQKEKNIHVNLTQSREKFLDFRKSRDKTLAAPRLLLPSIQVNIAAGELPQAEDNGTVYLKTPIRLQN